MRLLLATGEHSGRKDQKTRPLDICQASLPTKKIFSITEQFLAYHRRVTRNTQMVSPNAARREKSRLKKRRRETSPRAAATADSQAFLQSGALQEEKKGTFRRSKDR